ncbi:MAG TPA: BrnA antitoxin family protein [Tahibacter sp.]|nr:BrnA antitoxin family protein [Tahibacter sp.]
MKDNYDFSKAKRAKDVSHLTKLREQAGPKTRITIMLDSDVIDEYRRRAAAAGTGYQTEINRALREYLKPHEAPLTEERLRQVLREELQAV